MQRSMDADMDKVDEAMVRAQSLALSSKITRSQPRHGRERIISRVEATNLIPPLSLTGQARRRAFKLHYVLTSALQGA